MADYDFPDTAEPPRLAALSQSFTANEKEKQLRDLFIAVFRQYLASQAFDLNVSGCAHLGSFDFVRKTVNADGLTILQGDREEAATRYLYRAWQARDTNGRGLHFLRTYLQLLFPNQCRVAQLWQDKEKPYATEMHSVLEVDENGNQWTPDPERFWLTSRIEIALDLSIETRSITTLANIFRSIVPARLVPQFRFWIKFECFLPMYVDTYLHMQKDTHTRIPYCGLIVTANPDGWFKLGRDDAPELAPKLGYCRVRTSSTIHKEAEATFGRVPRLGEPGRKLDGTWVLPSKPTGLYATFSLTISHQGGDIASNIENYETTMQTALDKDCVCNFDRTPRIGEPGRYLDGAWGIPASPRMRATAAYLITRYGDCGFDTTPRIGQPDLYVDGSWNVQAAAHMSASCEIKVSK